MGNSVSFGGTLPCTCLHSRKIEPVPDESVHVAGNGHVSVAGNGKPSSDGASGHATTTKSSGNGHTGHDNKNGPASSAYVNSASIASPLLQTHARETFPLCLLLIGLDGAGKTSFLQWMTQRYPGSGRRRRTSQANKPGTDSQQDPKPTMGFSREEVRYRKHSVVVHDLGGGKTIRGIWKNYFAEAHGIVLVVDSSVPADPLGNEQWDELNDVIDGLIVSDDSGLQARPLLVLLNKQDSKPAMDVDDFKTCVKISTLAEEYSMPLRIIPVCIREKQLIQNPATRHQLCNKSVEEALQWMIKCIELHFPILHMKVQQDTKAQIVRDEQLRRERTARLKAAREAADIDAEEVSDVIGSNPFIPLDEHLQRVERKKSSLVPPAPGVMELLPLKSTRSEPSLSRMSDEYSASEVLMDTPPAEGLWRSSQDVGSTGDAGEAGTGSIGDISGTEEEADRPGLKTSRPPIYKRAADLGDSGLVMSKES